MEKAPSQKEYSDALIQCEELKIKIEELENSLQQTVNQGLSNKFEEYSKQLINWIEEVEFNLNLIANEQN